jgi:4-amino-4-deoxy-L-arabinose transferase-like glycosyltransferase
MIIVFLLLTSVLRLWHGASTGLSNDEAYYWCWSRRLDYWYFDQGPGIAWSLRATTSLLGNSTFAIRSCAILYSIGSLLFLRAFVRNVADERTANWTVVLASAAPLVSLGAVIATYDAPQVFFWCAGLWALERALSGNRVHWLTCSLLCLAGTFSKVPMVFFPLGALLAMATNPAWRHHLRTPYPWLAGLVGIAPLGAMLLWDLQHDHFYTLHTLGLGRRHVDASPGRWLGDFLGGQALSVGPGIFLAECAALATLLLRRSPSFALSDNLRRFALAFTVPMLAVCIINSTRSKLEINWPISAHMTGIALVAAWWVHLWHQGKRTMVVALAAPSLLIQAVAWHPEIVTYAGMRPTGKSVSKLTENRGRYQIEAAVREEAAALETETGKRPFRAAVNYKVSAILTYMAPNHEEASCLFPGTRRNQFSIWTKPETLVGRDAVVVLDQDAESVVGSLATMFQTVEPPRTVLVEDPAFRGPIKAWTILRCRNFLGYDPEKSAVGY